MILASCPPGGTVLDPFAGSGTTGEVAERLGRGAVLIELNPKYVETIKARLVREKEQCAEAAE
jgi:site-specific DNA-methyltransferase (adenine-specific)